MRYVVAFLASIFAFLLCINQSF